MTLPEIQRLVRRGEMETLEFKTKANHPEKIVKEMVAFANTKGGQLLEFKPHYALIDQPKNRRKGYIRVADRSVQANREMKEILRRERKKAAVKFTYGENENVLMKYLEKHDFITLKSFAKVAGIRPYQASCTLINLVLAKVIQIIPREGEDWYRFNIMSV